MKIAIISILVIIIGVASYFGYIYFTKKSLVDKIMEKGKSSPTFDASREGLMKYDIKTLRGLEDGSIR